MPAGGGSASPLTTGLSPVSRPGHSGTRSTTRGRVDRGVRARPITGDGRATPTLGAMADRLLVKVTCGTDDPERANQGLTVAATALSAGVAVSLWLTGDGAYLVASGERRTADLGLEHATPAADLVDAVLAGGTVTLCTQCAARRRITEADVLPGVRFAGAAAFVEEAVADGTQALVY